MEGGNFSRTGDNPSQCDKAPSWQFIWRVSLWHHWNITCSVSSRNKYFQYYEFLARRSKDAYHHTIHAYTAGVAVAQRKKLILRMRLGRLLTAAIVHVVSFAARGVKAMR